MVVGVVIPGLWFQEAVKLTEETHAGSLAGHFPAISLFNTLSRVYWWEGMYSDVHQFCHSAAHYVT